MGVGVTVVLSNPSQDRAGSAPRRRPRPVRPGRDDRRELDCRAGNDGRPRRRRLRRRRKRSDRHTTAELDGKADVGRNVNVTAKQSRAGLVCLRGRLRALLTTGGPCGRSEKALQAKFIRPHTDKVKKPAMDAVKRFGSWIKYKVTGKQTPVRARRAEDPESSGRAASRARSRCAVVEQLTTSTARIGDGVVGPLGERRAPAGSSTSASTVIEPARHHRQRLDRVHPEATQQTAKGEL